jgi:hypothetical protein
MRIVSIRSIRTIGGAVDPDELRGIEPFLERSR